MIKKQYKILIILKVSFLLWNCVSDKTTDPVIVNEKFENKLVIYGTDTLILNDGEPASNDPYSNDLYTVTPGYINNLVLRPYESDQFEIFVPRRHYLIVKVYYNEFNGGGIYSSISGRRGSNYFSSNDGQSPDFNCAPISYDYSGDQYVYINQKTEGPINSRYYSLFCKILHVDSIRAECIKDTASYSCYVQPGFDDQVLIKKNGSVYLDFKVDSGYTAYFELENPFDNLNDSLFDLSYRLNANGHKLGETYYNDAIISFKADSQSLVNIKAMHIEKDSLSYTPSCLFFNMSYTLSSTSSEEDRFESNNIDTLATPVSIGQYDSLTLPNNDTDYYFIALPKSCMLQIKVSSQYYSDISVSAFDSSSHSLSCNTAISNDTVIRELYVCADEKIYIRLTEYLHEATVIPYVLTLDTLPFHDDSLEPNNDVKFASIIDTGRTDTLVIINPDTDWYKLPVPARSLLNTNFQKYQGDRLILSFHSSNSYSTIDSSRGPVYSSQIITGNGVFDTLLIRVFSPYTNRAYPTLYGFVVQYVSIDSLDDINEPDNNRNQATLLLVDSVYNQVSFYNDTDWVKIPSNQLDSTSIFLSFKDFHFGYYSDSTVNHLSMEVFSGKYLTSIPYKQSTTDSTVNIQLQAFNDDTLYACIYRDSIPAFLGKCSLFMDYQIAWSAKENTFTDDPLENNDARDSASHFPVDSSMQLISNVNDTDWYFISPSAKSLGTIIIDYLCREGFPKLSVQAFQNSNGIPFWKSGDTLSDTLAFKALLTSDDTLFISIANNYHVNKLSPIYYNLAFFLSGISVIDDSLEENDSMAAAKTIDKGIYDSLALYDEDWYQIQLSAYDTLSSYCMPLSAQPDSNYLFELRDSSSTILIQKKSASITSGFQFIVPQNGNYFIILKTTSASPQYFMSNYSLYVNY